MQRRMIHLQIYSMPEFNLIIQDSFFKASIKTLNSRW
jgi:hypothetical protein